MRSKSITTGSIWKNMLTFFFALLLGAFFQQLYNTIDAIIVGRTVGSDALGAVGGSAAMVVNLFLGFFLGLSSGATVVISQFFGAEKRIEIEKAVHTAIAFSIAAGAAITIIGVLITPWIISAMNTPLEQSEAATMYLRIFFLGMIPNLIYNMGAGILRAVGDSRRPLYVLIISCLVNIFLDVLFVIVLGLGRMGDVYGVSGVAIATILSQLVSAIAVVFILVKTDSSYKLDIRKIRIDSEMFSRILRIGIPAGFQTTTYTLSNTLIQSSINSLGKDVASAWAAYGKIDVLFWMTIGALGTVATTFAGQNYGAGKYDRVRSSVRQALIISTIITIPLSTLICLFGDTLFRIFVVEQKVIDIGVQMILYLAPFYITYICVEILAGALRGMGDALIPMLITLCGICVLRVIWVLAVFPLHRSIETIEMSYRVTWCTTSVLFIVYYFVYTKKKRIR
ncbi:MULTISPECIES: MATE family efflux transporter [unclassified Butyrivibrio]|uniref:MATE family efflux transporter n=1 Tax=unclassified Butyrivibrio TaxID=2639466 RepID=UPI0005D232BE|nr:MULTISPECIES: MATE family efflux transporter [unclassified Butyrivibrio]